MDKEILEQLEIAAKYNLSFAVNTGYATQLYNYINNLQQRIDKALEYIDYEVARVDGEIWRLELNDDETEKLLSILQDEEVK